MKVHSRTTMDTEDTWWKPTCSSHLVLPTYACLDPLRSRADHLLLRRMRSNPENQQFSKSIWIEKLRVGANASIWKSNLGFAKFASEDYSEWDVVSSLLQLIRNKQIVRRWRLCEKCRGCKWVLPCRNIRFVLMSWIALIIDWVQMLLSTKIHLLSWMK